MPDALLPESPVTLMVLVRSLGLGGHQDRDWSDERQEYLHDVDERSDENHQRYGAFGQKSIRHLRNELLPLI
jgi:hypothetical protein